MDVNADDNVAPIEDPDDKPSPKEVLFEQMYFYRTKAIKIGRLIAKYLKEEEGRGQELVALFKHLTTLKKEIVEVASKLAPYEPAKLESIEVKAAIEHKFVIRAPIVASTTQEFLKSVNKKPKPPIASSKPFLVDDIRNTDISKKAYEPTDFEQGDKFGDEEELNDFKQWEN